MTISSNPMENKSFGGEKLQTKKSTLIESIASILYNSKGEV